MQSSESSKLVHLAAAATASPDRLEEFVAAVRSHTDASQEFKQAIDVLERMVVEANNNKQQDSETYLGLLEKAARNVGEGSMAAELAVGSAVLTSLRERRR